MGLNMIENAQAHDAQQAAGWLRRQGMATEMDFDLTSSGVLDGVDQPAINRKPDVAGAPQAAGASDIADKVFAMSQKAERANDWPAMSKLQAVLRSVRKVQARQKLTNEEREQLGVTLKALGLGIDETNGQFQKSGNAAQKCSKCGSVWLEQSHGHRENCQMCGSTELTNPLAKVSTRASDRRGAQFAKVRTYAERHAAPF
jgi:uncharacterized protein with gpF-like domain